MGFLQLMFLPFQRRCMVMVSEAFWEIRAIAEARGRSLMVTISLYRESLTLPFICFPNLLRRQRRSHPFNLAKLATCLHFSEIRAIAKPNVRISLLRLQFVFAKIS